MTSHVATSASKSTNVRPLTALGLAARLAPGWVERRAARAFLTPRRQVRHHPATLPAGRPVPVPGLAAWSWGDGPAVLLVHGWEDDHRSLAGFVGPLVAQGLRPVALDLPAHGRSPGRIATLPMMAQAIAGLAHAAAPVRGVIAHSLGGLAAALALPGLPVSRIVLIAAPSDPSEFARLFAARLGLDTVRAAGMVAAVERIAGEPMAALGLPDLAARQRAAALFVHSSDDRTVSPGDSRRNAASWPGAALHLADGLGHRRLLRDPDVVARAVAFIATDMPQRVPASPLDPFDALPSTHDLRAGTAGMLRNLWREWRARGRARRELARLDARTLHDVGLSQVQVDYEAGQPFWRPLRDWRA